jgi:hypothetical protein
MKYYRLRHKPTGFFIKKNKLEVDPQPFTKKPSFKSIRTTFHDGYPSIKSFCWLGNNKAITETQIKVLDIWYACSRQTYQVVDIEELNNILETTISSLDGFPSIYAFEIKEGDLEVVEYELVEKVI